MLRHSSKFDQISETSLDYHALLLTLIQQLLLPLRKSIVLRQDVLLCPVVVLDVLCAGVHGVVRCAQVESGVKGWPRRHKELLLISSYINNTIFILHEVLKAGRSIHDRRHTDGCVHKTNERHYYLL